MGSCFLIFYLWKVVTAEQASNGYSSQISLHSCCFQSLLHSCLCQSQNQTEALTWLPNTSSKPLWLVTTQTKTSSACNWKAGKTEVTLSKMTEDDWWPLGQVTLNVKWNHLLHLSSCTGSRHGLKKKNVNVGMFFFPLYLKDIFQPRASLLDREYEF